MPGDQSIIEDILDRWEDARERGESLSVEELCRGNPDLLGAVRIKVLALEKVERRLQDGDNGSNGLDIDDVDQKTVRSTNDLECVESTGLRKERRAGQPANSAIGEKIGPYEITKRIGGGGFGDVYQAIRKDGFAQKVAIKLIRQDRETTKAILARFELERQLLADLEHENIARLLDGGRTTDGRPYFVMEYVDGKPITQYCDDHRMAIDERLLLFVKVCRAVSHAHQLGVIHRDLKPSNILVTSDGTPKLVDFGIAKLVDVRSRRHLPTLTETGLMPMTPEYASPEQACGEAVSMASDVYSLGIVLYELLVGRRPYEVNSGNLIQILEVIRECEPLRPSSALFRALPSSSVSKKAPTNSEAVGKRRSTMPERLRRKLGGDLDAIVMMSLRKEPKARYASAGRLADDIEHYFSGLPVQARKGRLWYRANKFMRRNWVATLSGIAVLLSLIVGITVTLAGWRHSDSLNQQLTQSLAQRDEAVGQAEREKNRASDAYAELADRTAFLADERGDVAEAALWFTHAARQWTTADNQNSHEDSFRAAAWLSASPRPIAAFRHTGRAPYRVTLSDEGNYLLLEDSSRGHVIWDVDRDKQVSLPLRGVGPVAISPDAARVARASADGTINIYSLSEPFEVMNVSAAGPISAIAFSPDSGLLAIASSELQVWRFKTKDFLKATDSFGSRINYLTFDSTSKTVLTHDTHGRISVWGLEDDGLKRNPAIGNISHVLSTGSHGESPIDPMINTYCVVVRKRNNILEAYSLANGALIWQYAARWPISSVSLSPDGDKVVVTGKEAQIWRIGGRTPERTVVGNQDSILATALSGKGEVLVTGGLDCETSIWRWSEHKALRKRIQHLGHVTNVSVAGKKPDLIATAQRDGLVRVWKTAFPGPAQIVSLNAKPPLQVIVSKDRRYAMAGGSIHWERSLKETQVFDAVTGETAGPPLGPGGIINGCVFSLDGKHVVTLSSLPENAHLTSYQNVRWAEKPGVVTVWDWQTGTKKGEAWTTPSEPVDAEYLPSGEELAVVCAGGEILLMNGETGKVRREMRHGNQAELMWSAPKRRIVVSPTGDRIATLGLGQTIKVWNHNDGRLLCAGVHNDAIKDAEFSHDGRWLATSSMDNTARVWDCDNGKEVAKLQHTDWVFGVTFDKDADRIMTACRDHTARIWNWKKGSEELVLRHQDEVTDAAFAGEGQVIATTTFDGHAYFWSRRTGKLLAPPAKGSHNLQTLAITGDGSSIIASSGEYGSPAFNVFHLPHSVKDRSLPKNDLERVAVLFAGRRLGDATPVRLTTDEWMQRWKSVDPSTIRRVSGPELPDEQQLLLSHEDVRPVRAIYDAAVRALGVKDFDRAFAELSSAKDRQEKVIKSNRHPEEYYNLACLSALLAQTESERGGTEESVSLFKQASADAFQKAIQLGYSDFDHAKADKDLEFVRHMPEFTQVLGE